MFKVEALSNVPEDHYITHLANPTVGKNPIGWGDSYKAYCAQKHPLYNKIASSITSSVKSVALTTFGLMASPLLFSGTRESIIGSGYDVCTASASNVYFLTNLVNDAAETFQKYSTAELAVTPHVSGWAPLKYAAGSLYMCMTEPKMFDASRLVNYVGSLADTMMQNHTLIGASAAGLPAYFLFSKMNALEKKECATEKQLKSEITEKYAKIATRLSSLAPTPEVKKCAEEILRNQLQINQEVHNLGLPNLRWEEVCDITQPVFDAAQQKVNEKTEMSLDSTFAEFYY